MHRTLGMMAKYWEKGQVKTRLARSLVLPANTLGILSPRHNESAATGAVLDGFTDPMDAAAKIHQVFVEYLLGRLSQSADRLELVASPPSRLPSFQALAGEPGLVNWQIIDQGAGDLGARMKRWFARHLPRPVAPPQSSDRACVLIGADCPLLSPADLDVAWTGLVNHDLVLGPAFDGGYYLIGMSCRSTSRGTAITPPVHADLLADLFDNIPWGTETVFQRTVVAAEKIGLSVAILDRRHDIDTADDLQTLLATLRDSHDPKHPLLTALRAMKTR